MASEDIESKIKKVVSNIYKQDQIISNLKRDIGNLTTKRNELKEDITKLNEQVVSVTRDLSSCGQIKLLIDQEIKTKSQDIKSVAIELEQLKWQNKWHNIIAENQTVELEANCNRMEVLSASKKSKESNKLADTYELNIQEEKEIEQLRNENEALEQQIQLLKRNISTYPTLAETEKEITFLQNRNDEILKRMKCQFAQLEYSNTQDHAYLNSLQKEAD